MRSKLTLIPASCLLLACAGIQSTKMARLPDDVAGAGVALAAARPVKDDVAPRGYEVEGKSTYFQQSGGGSLALGLAFGAIGAAINAANVDKKTQEMGASGAASGLYQIDARDEARVALEKVAPAARRAGAPALEVLPYAVYVVADEAVGVETQAGLRVERAVNGERKLVASYTFCLDGPLPLARFQQPLPPQELAARREALRSAFAELYREVLADVGGQAPRQELARVKARALGPLELPWNVSRNAAGHRVLRRLQGWGDTYMAIVFAADSQYQFTEGPVPREERPAQPAGEETASASW